MLVTSRTVRGRCPLCGATHATCGAATDITPVDERIDPPIQEDPAMSELRIYTVEIGGQQRRLKLSAEDAERLGATPVESEEAKKPANKARKASTKTQRTRSDE